MKWFSGRPTTCYLWCNTLTGTDGVYTCWLKNINFTAQDIPTLTAQMICSCSSTLSEPEACFHDHVKSFAFLKSDAFIKMSDDVDSFQGCMPSSVNGVFLDHIILKAHLIGNESTVLFLEGNCSYQHISSDISRIFRLKGML